MAEQLEASRHWIDAWAELQRKSWESWSSLAQQALTSSHSAATDPWQWWQEGWARWREMLLPNADAATQDVYRKLLDQSTHYLRMSQDMLKAFQGMQTAVQMGEDWMKVLNHVFEQARDSFAKMSIEGNDLMRGYLALWGLPLDTWHRVSSSLSLFPGDMLQAVKEGDSRRLGDVLHANLQRFLSIPPVGYTREWQELGQEALQSWLQYQHALSGYLRLMARAGGRTLELMQHRLLEMASAGKQVESLRQFYDLWVDCAEEAYSEVTSAAEFGEASAQLVNAAMTLKRQSQCIMEEAVSTLNLPTRLELDSAHYRVHQLKREVKALQQELKALRAAGGPRDGEDRAVQELRREMEALKEALEQVRAEPAATAGPGEGTRAPRTTGARGARSKAQPRPATSPVEGE